MGKALGIISLICGLLGLFGGWFLGFVIPFGEYYLLGIAIVTGLIGVFVQDSKGMAIAGLILGIIGVIFVYLFLYFILILLAYMFPAIQ